MQMRMMMMRVLRDKEMTSACKDKLIPYFENLFSAHPKDICLETCKQLKEACKLSPKFRGIMPVCIQTENCI